MADAAIYTRLSHTGERSIEEQEQAGREACEAHGWPVAEVYSDQVSASRFARGEREDWARLIDAVDESRIGVLVLWETSRGDRDPETWLGLLRRCRDHHVLIHIVSEDQTYDPARARDWKTLADSGIDSAFESEKTSLRVRRALTAAAIEGRPHGQVPYGYERVYDTHTRELREQRPHPAQAPIVAEIVRRLAAGEPISAVCDDLNRRGIPGPKGGPWRRPIVRRIALSVTYLGKREHEGQLYDAVWPPIVPAADWYAVQRRIGERKLSGPGRRITRPGAAKYLLSYLGPVRCGVCQDFLKAFSERRGRGANLYTCQKGHVYCGRPDLDTHVTYWVAQEMTRPEWLAYLSKQASNDEQIVRARDTEAELRHRLDELARMAGGGEISPLNCCRRSLTRRRGPRGSRKAHGGSPRSTCKRAGRGCRCSSSGSTSPWCARPSPCIRRPNVGGTGSTAPGWRLSSGTGPASGGCPRRGGAR